MNNWSINDFMKRSVYPPSDSIQSKPQGNIGPEKDNSQRILRPILKQSNTQSSMQPHEVEDADTENKIGSRYSKMIYVSRLYKGTTLSDLIKCFSQFGQLRRVKLLESLNEVKAIDA
jgi:hypothetical protein